MQKALSNGTENVLVSSNSVISTFKIFLGSYRKSSFLHNTMSSSDLPKRTSIKPIHRQHTGFTEVLNNFGRSDVDMF